jgi:hypothetical protein
MLCVIKFDNGLYWCGYNKASEQLRKARIYNSVKHATNAGLECVHRKRKIFPQPEMSEVKEFKVVEVELHEKDLEQN